MPPNPYVNYTGVPSTPIPQASTKRLLPNGTASLTTSYQLLMRENAGRQGFDIQGTAANSSNIYVRFGTSGPEYELLSGGGGFSRNNKTGSVFVGDIYIKGGNAETFTAEEH